jgi:hypothetical protein
MKQIARHGKSVTGLSTAVVRTLLGLLTLLTFGCDDGRPKRVPVSGQVLIDGEPLCGGIVRVMPSGNRMAFSSIDQEGRFQLTTYEQGDGCVLGTHQVMVNGSRVEGDRRYWMAPKKYWAPNFRGLTTTIDGPTDSLKIELTWGKGRPFSEIDLGRDRAPNEDRLETPP